LRVGEFIIIVWQKEKIGSNRGGLPLSEYIIPAQTKYPDYYYQKRQLTEAKKTNPELKEVPSQVL